MPEETTTPSATPEAAPKTKKKMNWTIVIILLVLIAAGVLGYLYWQETQKTAKLSNPTEAQKAETDALVAKVGKLIELPGDETPTVATVTDASKLKSQKFFERAENGDKVLIYTKAKKAILFRPSTLKVIEVAPVNIGEQK